MKTLRFLSQLVLATVLISGTAINASAQKKEDWTSKIMQEKIAFFTTEMNLTQEEAEDFGVQGREQAVFLLLPGYQN